MLNEQRKTKPRIVIFSIISVALLSVITWQLVEEIIPDNLDAVIEEPVDEDVHWYNDEDFVSLDMEQYIEDHKENYYTGLEEYFTIDDEGDWNAEEYIDGLLLEAYNEYLSTGDQHVIIELLNNLWKFNSTNWEKNEDYNNILKSMYGRYAFVDDLIKGYSRNNIWEFKYTDIFNLEDKVYTQDDLLEATLNDESYDTLGYIATHDDDMLIEDYNDSLTFNGTSKIEDSFIVANTVNFNSIVSEEEVEDEEDVKGLEIDDSIIIAKEINFNGYEDYSININNSVIVSDLYWNELNDDVLSPFVMENVILSGRIRLDSTNKQFHGSWLDDEISGTRTENVLLDNWYNQASIDLYKQRDAVNDEIDDIFGWILDE